jgi:hypothetical protein
MINEFERERDFRFSTLREQMLEHLFIAELMQEVWFGRKQTIEILRSETDSAGYDLALDCNGFIRHVQLKSSRLSAKTQSHSLGIELAKKRSGCAIWMRFDSDDTGRKASVRYHFYGSDPHEPLPDLSGFR